MSALPDIIAEYYPKGVRFMIVLLEDDFGNPPSTGYCADYAAKYGLPLDKIIVAVDPAKKSLAYYETDVVSLSIITDRKGVITYKDEINDATVFNWQIDYELKKMYEELGLDADGNPID